MPESFKATAPGSIMLMGEHAVLYGAAAIVCAIDRRIAVILTPRADNRICIMSERLGQYQTSIDAIELKDPFRFVLAAISQFETELSVGFDLIIQSQFSDKLGLGSSAAVAVAVVTVLLVWLKKQKDQNRIYKLALDAVRHVQKLGSGADVAASVFGGINLYRTDPFQLQKIDAALPLHLIYVGYKTPTVEVVKRVKKTAESDAIYEKIGDIVQKGRMALQQKNIDAFAKLCSMHQALQAELGVSDAHIDALLTEALALPGLLGAKISGSGLGDCILVLGDLPKNYFPHNAKQRQAGVQQLDVKISASGVFNEAS
ncbi:MAG: hypothetical protein A3C55_00890 [Gammaproteobacteria bacterium RIFCSPHIGHO2_02_FULL_42_13]|nr:MAG: hypothetical protein A3C55_00890 [Gammaproteobacteria bacterium RIFCSPHIGHO2_02_FULL_42_13]